MEKMGEKDDVVQDQRGQNSISSPGHGLLVVAAGEKKVAFLLAGFLWEGGGARRGPTGDPGFPLRRGGKLGPYAVTGSLLAPRIRNGNKAGGRIF